MFIQANLRCDRNFFEDLAGQACPWKQNYYSPSELFDILGPSARECLLRRPKSGEGLSSDFPDFNPVELDLDPNKFIDFLKMRQVPDAYQGYTFHRFFYGSNYAQSNPVFNPRFSYEVPTPFLRSLVMQEFRRLEVAAQMRLAEELAPYPQIAWIFYEALVIDALVSSNEGLVYYLWNDTATENQPFRLGPKLQTIPDLVCDSQNNNRFTPENNRIYIPPTGFTSNDAFAITEDGKRVVFLQVTTAQDHDLKPKGLHDVIKLFPKADWESIEWFFVFVSPTKRASAIARKHIHSLKSFQVDGVSIKVTVGWMVVKNINKSILEVLVSTSIVFCAESSIF